MLTIRKLARILLYKLAPKKKNRIVFTSFDGHYSDSPKYISEYLSGIEGLDIVWLVDKNRMDELPSNVRGVDIGTLKARWVKGTAALLVDNVYGGREYARKTTDFRERVKARLIELLYSRRNQPLFTTFHGTPYKRMGSDQRGNHVVDFICPNTRMFLGNRHSVEIYNHLTFGKIPMHLTGTPRNDILFLPQQRPELEKKLGLPEDKKVVLFAPTFRNDGPDVADKNIHRSGLNQLNEIDFERMFAALSAKFGGEWVFVCRFHYHVESMVNWAALHEKYAGRLINGNLHDDMAEYLVCSDILITDSSASMLDFMLSGRPCFRYFPDYYHYRDEERGFYIPEEKMPFPLALTFDELIEKMQSFDAGKYVSGVEELCEKLGYAEDGRASERIGQYILTELGYAHKKSDS